VTQFVREQRAAIQTADSTELMTPVEDVYPFPRRCSASRHASASAAVWERFPGESAVAPVDRSKDSRFQDKTRDFVSRRDRRRDR
jgi:hypothetical protein